MKEFLQELLSTLFAVDSLVISPLRSHAPRRWLGRLLEIVAVMGATSLWASPAAGQTPVAVVHTIDVWTAVSLGFADLGEEGGLAGQLAVSTAIDRMAITLRAAGAGEFADQSAGVTRRYLVEACLFCADQVRAL